MKRTLYFILLMLIASTVLTSCSQKPEDIKLSDLKTPCDYLDAIEKCVDSAIETIGNKSYDDLDENEKKHLKSLKKKIIQIGQAADKKYTEAKGEECESFDRIRAKATLVDRYW